MFIYTSYTANIVALLQSTTKTITTLQDLLQSKLELGVEDTPYARYYFPLSSEPVRKTLYQTKINVPNQPTKFLNQSYGIERMRQGMYAFHFETGIGYNIVKRKFKEHEKCGLFEINYMEVIDPWFVIRKNSPYKEIMKVK